MTEVGSEPGNGEEREGPEAADALREDVIAMIKTCYDPEIPVDIYELGVRDANAIYLQMTLTSPMCPVAETLPPEVEHKVAGVSGVSGVELELVWEPPWNPDMMSEAARLTLNM
jgi:metal-sulfur cluster biosynthetic enzyme